MNHQIKLLMLKGLPASGKSTYAKELVAQGWIRANKDDLRIAFPGMKEKQIIAKEDEIIGVALANGSDVVVDDTNFNPIHEERLRKIAEKHNSEFMTKFFDVTLEECIKRDSQRLEPVGAHVIKNMYDQYLEPKVIPIKFDEKLPCCFIFDIDGTLALMHDRGPYDWSKVGNDKPNIPVIRMNLILTGLGYEIFIFSGRDSACREETEAWLTKSGIFYNTLIMREKGDMTKDSIIKQGFYEKHIKGKYNVSGIFDDRNQVVEMWRDLGLPCFQAAEGDF